MDKGDLERIKHIKRYCEDIAGSVERFGNSFETFTQDIDYFNSVSMSIMQIGELSEGLSGIFKDATRTQMPWGLIKGMRNHFAHGYATMDRGDIWETAIKDIPDLLSFCDGVINNGDFKYKYSSELDGIEIIKYIGSANEIQIPEKIDDKFVVSIGAYIFSDSELTNLKKLTNITIPDSVTNISNDAFVSSFEMIATYKGVKYNSYKTPVNIIINDETISLEDFRLPKEFYDAVNGK